MNTWVFGKSFKEKWKSFGGTSSPRHGVHGAVNGRCEGPEGV
jgi:hypothetical protein